MPEDPDFPGLPEPAPAQSVAAYDEDTAGCDADRRAVIAGMVCNKAAELSLEAAGFCRTGATELAVVSTRGADAYHIGSFSGLLITARSDDSAGWSKGGGWRMDTGLMAKRWRTRPSARRCGAAIRSDLEPGEYPVVLENYAVDDMLEALSFLRHGRADGAGWAQLDERLARTASDEPAGFDL